MKTNDILSLAANITFNFFIQQGKNLSKFVKNCLNTGKCLRAYLHFYDLIIDMHRL